ncbi:uncharacterized protein LOC113332776 [Papaver somniferum]|uniref:uncharacterized protein LOC113332776 n=1 Tax=Papaver somniferum TaxID=3469 RepID=UPI000E6FA356|nr:uncharacterized protein LOC113332776 [Papaver somniferum]
MRGGLLHLFDFHHSSTSRKLQRQKVNTDGLEAPRNSLELSIEEASQCYSCFGENKPYAFHAITNSSKHTSSTIDEDPVREMLQEEMSKELNTKRNVPNVVARLMGMDTIPTETKSATSIQEKKAEIIAPNLPRKEPNGSIRHSPLGLKSSKAEHSVHYPSPERDSRKSRRGRKSKKPQPREHPQEEELQKFKKDFEAWQAARVWENTKIVDLGNIPRRWLAQEHLNKEKMALYADINRTKANDQKPKEIKAQKLKPDLKSLSQQESFSRSGRKDMFQDIQNECFMKTSPKEDTVSQSGRKDLFEAYQNEWFTSRSGSTEFEQVALMNEADKQEKSDIPTRIVILKPGHDRVAASEDSWTGSSEIVEEEGSIKDFLEEVKERLRFEMQGKSTKRDNARGGGIETPFSEKPSNPRQIARQIAKQVRESVTRDMGVNLLRSESFRSYASEIQVSEPDSPDFNSRETAKFLSERLRNVLKSDPVGDMSPVVGGSSRASPLVDYDERRPRPTGNILKTVNRGNYWEHVKDELEMQSRSFRYGNDYDDGLHMGENSPRNLVRSMSAPSGSSFGKLLLEDRQILTGAHIRRKHEINGNFSAEVSKTRKEKLSFRGKVSSLRHSLSFKGRLFGRKMQSVEDMESVDSNSVKDDSMCGSSSLMNLENVLDNSTEVPPSPASFCSTLRDDYYRNKWDHSSPVSTLDVPSIEDPHTVSDIFRDISSNLTELRRQLNKLGVDGSECTSIQEPREPEMVHLEDHAEVYIRDVLVISGLYDGSSQWSFTRWDPLAKPISSWVFEKVEESYEKRADETDTTEDHTGMSRMDHKVLFDLINEALSTILGPSLTMSKFKRKLMGSTKMPPPRGKKLLDVVWKTVFMYLYPDSDGYYYYYSLDGMIARDLGRNPWLGSMDEDIELVGREMENWILRELIGETVKDLL